jgi:anaerobic selenocysteine-containing dehydrogenase
VLDGVDPDATDDEGVLRTVAASGRDGADELVGAGPHGLPMPRRFGWVREHALPGGRWRVAPPVLVERLPSLLRDAGTPRPPMTLVSRRVVRVSNSSPYAGEPRTRVLVHPDDAAAMGVAEGDVVVIESDHGAMPHGVVVVDANIRRGVVSVSHGSHDANVCRLTSGTDLDPLSAQPVMSGLAVRVRLRDAAPAHAG